MRPDATVSSTMLRKPYRLVATGICLLLVLQLGALPCAASGSEKSVYTLDDLYRIALDRAESIAIGRETVGIAGQRRQMALSVLIPRITGKGNYSHFTEEKTVLGSVIQPQWTGSAGVTIGQSFTLNGRELTALQIAEADIQRTTFDLDAVTEAYLFQVAEAFYAVAKGHKGVDIAQANLDRLRKHREAVNMRLKLAEVPKTELFRTEAELAQSEVDHIRAENALRLAQVNLAAVVGMPLGFEIRETGVRDPLPELGDPAALKSAALEDRSEMKSLRMQERIAEDQIEYTRGDYWPKVSVEGAFFYRDQEPFSEFLNRDSMYVALEVDVPIYDGGLRGAQVREATHKTRQARLVRRDKEKQIRVEVEEALLRLKAQRGVLASLDAQLQFSNENFRSVSRLYDHGMANIIDVLDANTLLLNTEQQLAEARYNLKVALLNLKRARGIYLTDILSENQNG